MVLFRTIELEVLTGLILDQRDYLGIIPAYHTVYPAGASEL